MEHLIDLMEPGSEVFAKVDDQSLRTASLTQGLWIL